jgi:hypothetical protein
MKKISKLLFLILLMSNIMVNPVLADDDKTIIVACRHFPWLADIVLHVALGVLKKDSRAS